MRNRALLEGSPVCNKIIDLDSRLVYMSNAGVKMLKIPAGKNRRRLIIVECVRQNEFA